jgi:hypothetical protein
MIETFDDWKDVFQTWQKDINYDIKLFSSVLHGYEFSEKFAGLKPPRSSSATSAARASGRIPARYHEPK